MGVLKEFKEFALKGNVIDLAVGIIIGAAFGKIVGSLVNDVVMPPVGLLVGGVDFSQLSVTLKAASVDAAGKALPAVLLKYGMFINAIVDFLIIAAAIFSVVKLANMARRKQAAAPAPAPAAPPQPTRQEQLLAEIRDVLKAR